MQPPGFTGEPFAIDFAVVIHKLFIFLLLSQIRTEVL